MGLQLSEDPKYQEDTETRLAKLATTLLGAEIDFIVRGINKDKKTGELTVVASRKDALLEKIKIYYATLDKNRASLIAKNPQVQARIISVGRKNIHVEVFGIQTQINATELFYEWIVDLRNIYSVGDVILIRVDEIIYPEYKEGCENDKNWLWNIKIKANHKCFETDYPSIKFNEMNEETKVLGFVTDITDTGKYYITLKNGVNAIANSYKGNRIPMIGDKISFYCIRKNKETKKAEGFIAKILASEY